MIQHHHYVQRACVLGATCLFARELLVLLYKFAVLHLLPVFQSAHVLLTGFKFCVFVHVQGVYGVYLPLCVGVCLWACGGPGRMLGILLYPLSPLLLAFFSMMVWTFLLACVAGR